MKSVGHCCAAYPFLEVGKKIASKCKGLPLAANVLGGTLQLKKSSEEWENVWKSEVWQLEKAEVELFPHLLLSYNELSPTLKRCFSYCAAYPKDSEIDPDTLIEEWMALGYLGSVTGNNGGVEVKGRDYFNSLATRSLFQNIEESDGSIVGCTMHDIVHDFALFLRKSDDRLQSCQVCSPLLVCRVQEYRSLVWGVDSPMNVCDCLTSVRVIRFECGLPLGMKKLVHLRWLELSHNSLSEKDLKIICRLYLLQTLLLSYCYLEKIPLEIGNLVELRHLDLSFNGELKELPGEIGNLVELRHLDLNYNEELKELPESICNLVELRILNLNSCRNLARLPEGIHRLQNIQRLLIADTPASRCLPRGLGELSGLHTLGTDFYGGSGCNKLGLLKKLNGLRESLDLEINFTSSSSDFEELVKDAQEAELRSKDHIHTLDIIFKKDEVEGSSSSSLLSSSLWMDMMEALEPNLKKLNELVIQVFMGSRLPEWISSPLSSLKDISLLAFDELSSLPPLGRLPFLEDLSMSNMYGLKFVGREFLGIQSSSSSSSTKEDKEEEVVVFPKLKRLYIYRFPGWTEWEDITAEEEESAAVSIMPCLEELRIRSCESLKKLPHGLLRKASSSLRILNIEGSGLLKTRYGDEDGSEWRSVAQYNPQLQLRLNKY